MDIHLLYLKQKCFSTQRMLEATVPFYRSRQQQHIILYYAPAKSQILRFLRFLILGFGTQSDMLSCFSRGQNINKRKLHCYWSFVKDVVLIFLFLAVSEVRGKRAFKWKSSLKKKKGGSFICIKRTSRPIACMTLPLDTERNSNWE